MEGKSTLTVKEMAEYLHIGNNTAYDLVHSKGFYPAFKIGRKILVNLDKLKLWIDEQTSQGDQLE